MIKQEGELEPELEEESGWKQELELEIEEERGRTLAGTEKENRDVKMNENKGVAYVEIDTGNDGKT